MKKRTVYGYIEQTIVNGEIKNTLFIVGNKYEGDSAWEDFGGMDEIEKVDEVVDTTLD